MVSVPRFSLRSTGTCTLSITCAYISPNNAASVNALELTTSLRFNLPPGVVLEAGVSPAIAVGAAAPDVGDDPAVGVTDVLSPHAERLALNTSSTLATKILTFICSSFETL